MSSIERLPEEIVRLIVAEIKDKTAMKSARLAIPAFSTALKSSLFEKLVLRIEPESRSRINALATHTTLKKLVKELEIQFWSPFSSLGTYPSFCQNIDSIKDSFPNLTTIIIRFVERFPSLEESRQMRSVTDLTDHYILCKDVIKLINRFTAFRLCESSVKHITEMTLVNFPTGELMDNTRFWTSFTRLQKLQILYTTRSREESLILSDFVLDHIHGQRFNYLTDLSLHQRDFDDTTEDHPTLLSSQFPLLKRLSLRKIVWLRREQLEWIFSLSTLESICFDSCSVALCFSGQSPRCADTIEYLRFLQVGMWIAVKNSGPAGVQGQDISHCWWSDLRWSSILSRLQGISTLKQIIWNSTLVKRDPWQFFKNRGTWSGDFSARYVLLDGRLIDEGRTWHSNTTGSRSIWCDSKMLSILPRESLLSVNSDAEDGKASSVLAAARSNARNFTSYTGIKGYSDSDLAHPDIDFQLHGFDPHVPAVVSIKETAPKQLMRLFRRRFIVDHVHSERIYLTSKKLEPYLVNRARARREFQDLGGESAYQRQFCFGISEMEDQEDQKAWEDLQDELQSRRRNQWLLN